MYQKIVIATHGALAQGLYDALLLITKTDAPITALSCYTETCPDPAPVFSQLLAGLGQGEKLLVLTDMMFGSVNQQLVACFKDPEVLSRMTVITGINLPLVLSIVCGWEDDMSDEAVQTLVQEAREEILFVNQEVQNLTQSGQNCQDDDSL